MDLSECIFCRIAGRAIPSKIVYEDDKILAFEDIKPQAPAHCIVIPKSHISGLSEIKNIDTDLAGRLLKAAANIAEKVYKADKDGYRVVINCGKDAGQAVAHLHLHILAGRKFSWPPG